MRKTGQQLRRRIGAGALTAALLCLATAGAARAADGIYWSSVGPSPISFANLDGTSGPVLNVANAHVNAPEGTAIDPVTERIYWLNTGAGNAANAGISFANLDGWGGGDLQIPGAVFHEPEGLAIDPAGRRIYWANRSPSPASIWFANLDGSGGGELNTAGATVQAPSGVTVDPANHRLYWVNDGIFLGKSTVSFANLDNSGAGGNLATPGAPDSEPEGVAIDPVGQRIYWANSAHGESIAFANLDGSGGGQLNTTGATVILPRGVAVDPFAGRVYWINNVGSTIAFANLDSTGHGGDIGPDQLPDASFPVLFVAPRSSSPPAISRGSSVGSVLSCTQGTWAPDFVESFLYQAAKSFAVRWARNGKDIPGATRSTLTTKAVGGSYRCLVTASNRAGATTVASAPILVSPIAFDKSTKVTLTLATRRIPARGPLGVRVSNGNAFAISGALSAHSTARGAGQRRRVKLGAKAFRIAAKARRVVRLSLPKPLQRLLAQRGRLPLHLSATVTDLTHEHRTVKKTVVAKLRVRKQVRRRRAPG
jgi:hypothetical protein